MGKKYKIKTLLEKFHLEKLKFNLKFIEMEFSFEHKDKVAAWELYIELITRARASTQPLSFNLGDEKTALESLYSLFAITRNILKRNGVKTIKFTAIAVAILNQIIRPFTTNWHTITSTRDFNSDENNKFRSELQGLQKDLKNYTFLLAEIADVEDLTEIK